MRAQTFVNGTINYTTEDDSLTTGIQIRKLFDLRRGQVGAYSPTNAGAFPNDYRAYNEPRMISIYINKSF